MRSNYKKLLLISCLILVSFGIYHQLFLPGTFTYGDWGYFNLVNLREKILPQIWVNERGLGAVDVTFWQAPFRTINGLLASLIGINMAQKLLIFLPISTFGIVGSYLILSQLFKAKLAIFVGSLIYLTNTYFLSINTQGHLFLTLACNLALIFIGVLHRPVNLSLKIPLLSLLALSVAIIDLRIAYILAIYLIIFLVYFLINSRERIVKLKTIGLVGVATALLSMYWLLPLGLIGQVASNSVLSKNLFGSEFWSFTDALTLHHPFWNGTKPVWFYVNSIPLHFWIIPLIAFSGLVLNRHNKKIVFFGVVTLFGLVLAKQIDNPFPSLYPYLYNNLPGFSAFREATKFYFLIAVGYMVLSAAFIEKVYARDSEKFIKKSARYFSSAALIGVFLLNVLPFLNNSIETLFTPRKIPQDYNILRQVQNSSTARSVWIPVDTRWTYFSNHHPKTNITQVLGNNWTSTYNGEINVLKQHPSQYVSKIFNGYTLTSKQFSNANMKYVIVPIRDQKNDNDIFSFYGDDRQFYVDLLDSVPWLKKVDIGTKELAVYENENYKPYFSSFTNLTNINGLSNLDEVYNFATNELGNKDFQFQVTQEKNKTNKHSIHDLFGDLKRSELKSTGIERTFETNKDQGLSIHANNNRPVINYKIQDNVLTFEAQKLAGPFVQQTNSNLVQGTNSGISSAPLDDGEYYVNVEKDMLAVNRNRPNRSLGVVKTAPILMKADTQNLIPNSSLEEGLWQKRVSDCNKYDNNAQINQTIDTKSYTDGKQSLLLESDKHTACTGPNVIPVTPSGQYLLSFDYVVEGGRQAGYEIQYIGSKTKPRKEYLYINDNNWRQASTLLNIPSDATGIKILVKGFPDDRNKQHAVTHYDNLRLSNVSTVLNTNIDMKTQYTKTDLKSRDSLNIKYENPSLKYENKIKNGSMEQGLWQKEVGDCNAFDDKPKLGMNLSDEHSDGSKSLQLEAKSHIACTSPDKVRVKENGKYLLSFDYQSPNAENAGYYVAFNDPARTTVSEQLQIEDDDWENLTKTITAPYGATEMQIVVYAYSTELGNVNVINRYDNFFLTEVPDITDQYYLTSTPKLELKPPEKVNFELNSPTKKTIHVKDAETPFYLAMSEAYHPQWRLVFNNEKVKGLSSWVPWAKPNVIPNEDHIKLNDFQNGWYIDTAKLCVEDGLCTRNPDGSFNLELIAEFAPQRWFYIGLIISGTTLVGCVGYLVFYAVRRRKQVKGERETDKVNKPVFRN